MNNQNNVSNENGTRLSDYEFKNILELFGNMIEESSYTEGCKIAPIWDLILDEINARGLEGGIMEVCETFNPIGYKEYKSKYA